MDLDGTRTDVQRSNRQGASVVNRPPLLVGYTYDPEDARKARDENRLLAIRLETNRSCNLRCRYCYAQGGESLANELGYYTLAGVVRQAKELGVASVVVIGGGEPTIYPRFRDLVSLIHSLDIVPVVFTNTITMTTELARFLRSCWGCWPLLSCWRCIWQAGTSARSCRRWTFGSCSPAQLLRTASSTSTSTTAA